MRGAQRGAALVIVMVLSLALGTLALASMTGAVASLVVASHAEEAALAFRAAEAGIETTLESGVPLAPGTMPWPDPGGRASVTTWIVRDAPNASSPWSHAAIVAEGRAGRSVVVRLEQGFAIGPSFSDTPLRTSWRPLPHEE